ncbi:MAG: dipicolinate synthase subunit B [Clostridia bacterium]|nr:dipicolinate synthase subunit B [Clostridia bacterium]
MKEDRDLIGYAICGSFCTISHSLEIMKRLILKGYELLPIMSDNAYNTDTRFGNADKIREQVVEITGKNIIHTIKDAEPLGPAVNLDAMIIAPCTGNTLAKIANGITDTSVCMAAKAHLRNDKPLIIALASNDALSGNLKNIGTLLNRKSIFFTPMVQDDPLKKPHSLVADFTLIEEALLQAMSGKQIPKMFI